MPTDAPGFWWRSLGGPPPPREPLRGPAEVDVAIVGAGYTGLWTAYYLKHAQPSLRVAVLERERAGFGASGRNGGWVSGFFSGPASVYERSGGRAGLVALQRQMLDSVDEVARVLAGHGISADYHKGGQLSVAFNDAQAARLAAWIASVRERGLGEQDVEHLTAGQLRERVHVSGARAGAFSPHVARVHPAKLLAGLAGLVERLGVPIYESTPVREIRAHEAVARAGSVHARWVVCATEGYTPSLRGRRRALVPLNSSMIITAPLPEDVWERIGWRGEEVMSDQAHAYVYLQRTADGRIAIGGRGVPYRFASRTDAAGETAPATAAALRRRLAQMFPCTRDIPIEDAWSGVLGVPRDWCPTVAADRSSGTAWAGGYVGQGVAAANLAGRTLRDLLLERETPLTALPWVGRKPRRWEPEPLRWAAIHGVYGLYRMADRHEQRSGKPSRLAGLADAISRRR